MVLTTTPQSHTLAPQRAAEAAVTEQPMIAKVDSGGAEDIDPDYRKRDAGRAEEPRQEGIGSDRDCTRDATKPVSALPTSCIDCPALAI
jgi:hypothetical protein